MKEKKKATLVSISFKDNINDKMILEWLEEKSETIGKSAYIKQLLLEQLEKENNNK